MTTTLPARLGPSLGRFFAIFAVLAILMVLPVGLMMLAPPAYVFAPSGFDAQGEGRHRLPGQITVTTTRFETAQAARAALARTARALRTTFASTNRELHRYTLARTRREGLLLAVDGLFLQIEAPDREGVDRTFAGLPFIRPNDSPGARVADWFTLPRLLLCLGVYVLLWFLALPRAGAWAARTSPAPGTSPVSGDELRAQLLAINSLAVPLQIRETKRGHLVAEWRVADTRWTSILEKGGLTVAASVTMQLDDRNHIVRNIDTSRTVRWSAGVASFSWSFSFFRGIDFGSFDAAAQYGLVHTPAGWQVGPTYKYRYSLVELQQPIVVAVVSSGWTWQPVLTFFRPIGG